MVVSNSSFPSSEHFVLICNSLNRKIPRSFIVAKRQRSYNKRILIGLFDRQSQQRFFYITIIHTHVDHLFCQRRKKAHLIRLRDCGWALGAKGLKILRKINGNLLGRQLDMAFIILSYMLYRIRLFDVIEVYFYLSIYYFS